MKYCVGTSIGRLKTPGGSAKEDHHACGELAGAAHLYVFYVSWKLWEAHLYVLYVSWRLRGVPDFNDAKPS